MAIFRVSVSRVFKAGAATALEAEADSVVIASVVAADSAAVIGLAVEHSAAVAASADSAAAGADGNNLGLGFASNFSYNQNLNQPTETNI